MVKNLLIAILFALTSLISSSALALKTDIHGPEIKIKDNDIIVSTGLSNLEEIESAIKSGIEKEMLFTIELFRVWKFWPDEFVLSKKIQRTIKYDNLRARYLTSSYDGTSQGQRIFTDFDTMKIWAFRVTDINLANIKELERGDYYIRVVVESRSRELPRVIGLLMLFIPETEMSLAKESKPVFISTGYKK